MENSKGNVEKNLKTIFNKVKKPTIIIIIVVLIIVFNIISSYVALMDEFSNKIGEHMKNNPVSYTTDSADKSIQITDKTIDGLIKVINSMGLTLKDLKLKKEELIKLYMAEVVTSEINRVNIANGEKEEDGKYYGRVYIKRKNPTTDELEQLKFEPSLETFKNMDATKILEYFSINEDKICIASTQTTTDNNGTQTTSIRVDELSYKDDISQYTIPIEFLLDLCLITQDSKFVLDFADKIINETEIVIQVLQNKNTTQIDTIHKYSVETEKSQRNYKFDREGKLISTDTNTEEPTISDPKSDTTTQIQTNINSSIQVQSVKNWIMEVSYEYSKVDSQSTDGTEPEKLDDEPKKTHNYNYSYIDAYDDGSYNRIYTSIITRKINQTTENKITINTSIYQKQPGDGVKDKTEEFIEFLKKHPSVLCKLIDGSGLFFEMLKNGERTQTLEQLMRYILGKVSENNYGVTDFNFEIFDIKDFNTIGGIYGSTVEDKVWFSLKKLGYKDEVIAGAMGNIYCESEFNTSLLNSSSGAYGLAQWKDGRRASLQAYATSKGKTEDDVDTQIEFLIAELTGTGDAAAFATRRTAGGKGENYCTYSDWANATDAREAAIAYCWFFETPSNAITKTADILITEDRRADKAEEYLEIYQNRSFGVTTDEEAANLQNYIETELIHTQVHIKNSKYQNGPFAKWWEINYNTLTKFQCTWWANGRASMYLEQNGTKYTKYPTLRGDGGEYYDINKQNGWFKYGSTPKANSIISWKKAGGYGHVAYVEGIAADGSGIYISHAGSGKTWYGVQKIPLDGTIWNNYVLNGYIYLDEPN